MSSSLYSQNAKSALRTAHYLARHFQHKEVDTDHLFVGILQTENSVGAEVLRHFGIEDDQAITIIRQLHHTTQRPQEKVPFSFALRDALAVAIAESKWLNQDYIGTEHFLLGVMRTGRGRLRELLIQLDLQPDQIRGRVKRLVQDGISEITMEAARRMSNLSELGKRVLNAAEYMAIVNDHRTITPLHLLLALAQEQRGIGFVALPECGLHTAELISDIETLPRNVPGGLVMTNHLIDGAVERAEILGTHYTGTEHLLLAMTVDPDGQAILEHYGVDLRCLQSHLRAVLLP